MFRFHPVFGAVAKCPYQYEHLKGARALQESPDSLQQAWIESVPGLPSRDLGGERRRWAGGADR